MSAEVAAKTQQFIESGRLSLGVNVGRVCALRYRFVRVQTAPRFRLSTHLVSYEAVATRLIWLHTSLSVYSMRARHWSTYLPIGESAIERYLPTDWPLKDS